jgi:hypothetical protein
MEVEITALRPRSARLREVGEVEGEVTALRPKLMSPRS